MNRHSHRLGALEAAIRAAFAKEPNEYAERLGVRYGIAPADIMAEADRLLTIAGPKPSPSRVASIVAAETGQPLDDVLQEVDAILADVPPESEA